MKKGLKIRVGGRYVLKANEILGSFLVTHVKGGVSTIVKIEGKRITASFTIANELLAEPPPQKTVPTKSKRTLPKQATEIFPNKQHV